MRLIYVTHLLFSALLLTFVPVASSPVSHPADHTVTEDDKAKEIRLARGDTVTVRLGAQLGTGYAWYVTSGPGRRLQQDSQRPKIEANRNSAPGSSEVEVFQFTARRTGRVRLEFRYGRPRQNSAAALKTFYILIVIK